MKSELLKLKELVEKSIKFTERMGLKVLDITPLSIKLLAPIKGNENHIGTMYAGALFTIAEIPGGALCYTAFDGSKFFPVVKDMRIEFKKIVKTDVTIEMTLSEEEVARISKEAEENGKADFVVKGEVIDAEGDVVAKSSGLYQIRKVNYSK